MINPYAETKPIEITTTPATYTPRKEIDVDHIIDLADDLARKWAEGEEFGGYDTEGVDWIMSLLCKEMYERKDNHA